jgi:hypothetical protein
MPPKKNTVARKKAAPNKKAPVAKKKAAPKKKAPVAKEKAASLWNAFTAKVTDQNLATIQRESLPQGQGNSRSQSDLLWDLLAPFGKKRMQFQKSKCSTDMMCLRLIIIETLRSDLYTLGEDDLKAIQMVASATSQQPFNSLMNWYPPINKVAKEVHSNAEDKIALIGKWMKLTSEQKQIQQGVALGKVVTKNTHLIPVDYPTAFRIVTEWAKSDNLNQLHLAVMAATGARKTAILDPRIEFLEVLQPRPNKELWIRQVGVLKDKSQKFKKEQGGEDDIENDGELVEGRIVEKPLAFGLTLSFVTKAIARIRNGHSVGGMNRQAMGNKYGPALVAEVKSKFTTIAKYNKRLGTHFLRALYANVSYQFFKDALSMSLTAFISTVLAHNSNSLSTALSYQSILIRWNLPDDLSADTKLQGVDNRMAIAHLTKRFNEREKTDDDADMSPRALHASSAGTSVASSLSSSPPPRRAQ